MDHILATLQRDPFTTPIGQLIEQATDPTLPSENWALNMEICDTINDTDEGPKDAMKAIRKRLQQNAGKNYTVVMYTLTVLETCVKNCGRRLHLLVTQKDFVQELVKLIGPKNDPPAAVQETVLNLIQTWAFTFRNNVDMQGVVQVYNDLKAKGVEFPPADLEALAPIHTPSRSIPVRIPTSRPDSGTPVRTGSARSATTPPGAASGPVQLTQEEFNKLKSELDIVQRNMSVFGDMLSELRPGEEHHSDWELLQELQKTCHAMQTRIVELLDKIANEQVTSELLRLNDEMNNLFLRYERFEKRRTAIFSGQQQQQNKGQASSSFPKAEASGIPPLIDLDAPENMSGDHATSLGAAGGAAKDEFDAFALARGSEPPTQPKPSLAGDPTVPDVTRTSREEDFDQIANWLSDKPAPAAETSVPPRAPQENITSSEFDRFLAERAAAADRLPTVIAATGSTSLMGTGDTDKANPVGADPVAPKQ